MPLSDFTPTAIAVCKAKLRPLAFFFETLGFEEHKEAFNTSIKKTAREFFVLHCAIAYARNQQDPDVCAEYFNYMQHPADLCSSSAWAVGELIASRWLLDVGKPEDAKERAEAVSDQMCKDGGFDNMLDEENLIRLTVRETCRFVIL
jgi:hypothetical protein